MPLAAHDLMPMFTVTSILDGAPFAFERVWQLKNLLLVSIPSSDPAARLYSERLHDRVADLHSLDTALVVTADIVPGIPSPGVVIADRWGEIYHVEGADHASDLPTADDLIEWVRFVRLQCPECQGEAR